MRACATAGIADQPVGRARVECELALKVSVAADRTAHIEPHDVVRAADTNRYAFACADVSFGTGECGSDGEFDRGSVTPRGHHVAVEMHVADHIASVRMMGVQVDRRTRDIGRKNRLERLVVASRQLAQRLQQHLQSVGLQSQRLDGLNTARLSDVEQRNGSENRPNTIAQRMCHAAKQIVMYGQPARRTRAVARD